MTSDLAAGSWVSNPARPASVSRFQEQLVSLHRSLLQRRRRKILYCLTLGESDFATAGIIDATIMWEEQIEEDGGDSDQIQISFIAIRGRIEHGQDASANQENKTIFCWFSGLYIYTLFKKKKKNKRP